jgi:hypothetical protein
MKLVENANCKFSALPVKVQPLQALRSQAAGAHLLRTGQLSAPPRLHSMSESSPTLRWRSGCDSEGSESSLTIPSNTHCLGPQHPGPSNTHCLGTTASRTIKHTLPGDHSIQDSQSHQTHTAWGPQLTHSLTHNPSNTGTTASRNTYYDSNGPVEYFTSAVLKYWFPLQSTVLSTKPAESPGHNSSCNQILPDHQGTSHALLTIHTLI